MNTLLSRRARRAIGIALLAVPLSLTFFVWHTLTSAAQRQSDMHFANLVRDSERAMQARLNSYVSAVRSGVGVFQSSQVVTAAEWRTFTQTLRLRDDFPGMLGLGWIEHQERGAEVARDVVTYMEPEPLHPLGADLGADAQFREAADHAAATGQPALSGAMRLTIGDGVVPGFLLLQPVDGVVPARKGVPAERRLRGFVYAPFLARELWSGTPATQSGRFDVTLFEGRSEAWPVFTSRKVGVAPRFAIKRELQVFGQTWTVLWQSTAEFERAEQSAMGYFVLFGGLMFTGLFAVLLVVIASRGTDQGAGSGAGSRKSWLLPLAAFAFIGVSSVAAYGWLSRAENADISAQVDAETRRVEAALERNVRTRLHAVRRMANRWDAAGFSSYPVWRGEARDMLRQVPGLVQLQWIGTDQRVRWSEGTRHDAWQPANANLADQRLALGLAHSGEQGATFASEPRMEGEHSMFSVYVPIYDKGQFAGYLAGAFDTRDFFRDALETAAEGHFAFAVKYEGRAHFSNGESSSAYPAWRREGGFLVNDRQWTFSLAPTGRFVSDHQTLLPLIVLLAGTLIAALAGVLLRYVLVARSEATRLAAYADALRFSEERYELALRGTSVGLWEWTMSSNDMFLSDRCKDLLRITERNFKPKYSGFTSRLHPEDRMRVERALLGHFKKQNAFDLEFRLRCDDDQYIWVHVSGQAHFDAAGFAERMAGSLRDITAEKRQATQLEQSEAQLRMLVENTPAAVAMFDTQMRYLLTSKRYLEDYDLVGRNVIGQSHYDVFPEVRNLPKWMEAHRRAMHGEVLEGHEDQWTRADGRTEWNNWSIHPWRHVDGRIGGIVMFTEFVTAQKATESGLRAAEAMNRAALDKSPIGKALVAPDGRFIKVNAALCQLLGYSEDELLATTFQQITHAQDLDSDLTRLRDVLEGRSPGYQMDKRYVHRDGRVVWTQLNVTLIRNDAGEIDYLVSQVQDIGERKQIEQMKDAMVSLVTQELRLPVTTVRDTLQQVRLTGAEALPPGVRQQLLESQAKCDRIIRLVENVVDLETLSSGQLQFDFQDVNVARITDLAVAANQYLARQYEVRFQLEPIDESLMIYVDPGRFEQALTNLLSNAAKFSPPGSLVSVGAELRGEWVRVFVRDMGEGIPDDFRGRIFGKFEHGDRAGRRHRDGAGLGLYVSRQIVEQMRGNVGFFSHVGMGSTFWLEFPRVTRESGRLSAVS